MYQSLRKRAMLPSNVSKYRIAQAYDLFSGSDESVEAKEKQLTESFAPAWETLCTQYPNFGVKHGVPAADWWRAVVRTTFLRSGINETGSFAVCMAYVGLCS